MQNAITSVEALRAPFERPRPATVGMEEELMLLDARTLHLASCGPEALEALHGDPRFKLEMPAAQLEIVTPPCATIAGAAAELAGARAALGEALSGRHRLAGAGAHPFSSGRGVLNPGPRYDAIAAEYGEIARRQLVFGLHVHVVVTGADRALAVYNGIRSYLPELAALAGNAPFYEGRDTGLASIRPKLCELLPRQGVPPALQSWETLAEALRWGAAAGRFPDPRQWWWEARLHPVYGTIEVRVADTQVNVTDSAAVGAVVHALVHRLAARHDAGEKLPPAATWRIEENRWSACRHGLEGELADLETGVPRPTRVRLAALLDELTPSAAELGCAPELADARRLMQGTGAARQRAVASERGLVGLGAWLADAFAPSTVSAEKRHG